MYPDIWKYWFWYNNYKIISKVTIIFYYMQMAVTLENVNSFGLKSKDA